MNKRLALNVLRLGNTSTLTDELGGRLKAYHGACVKPGSALNKHCLADITSLVTLWLAALGSLAGRLLLLLCCGFVVRDAITCVLWCVACSP